MCFRILSPQSEGGKFGRDERFQISIRLFMIGTKPIVKGREDLLGKRSHTHRIRGLEYRLPRFGVPGPSEGQTRGTIRKNSSDLVVGQPADRRLETQVAREL